MGGGGVLQQFVQELLVVTGLDGRPALAVERNPDAMDDRSCHDHSLGLRHQVNVKGARKLVMQRSESATAAVS